MRPAGEIRQALLGSACHLAAQSQAFTMRELAHHSRVGMDVTRRYVDNLKRAGALQVVGQRRVDYRKCPVAVYAPAQPEPDMIQHGWVDLGQCMAAWAR